MSVVRVNVKAWKREKIMYGTRVTADTIHSNVRLGHEQFTHL
jgi:hypothetical protein